MDVRRWKPSTIVVVTTFALVVGLEAPAMAHQAGSAAGKISGSLIKKHSIAGNRLKPNTITGAQIKESTLGRVPKATEALRLPSLVWHPITTFQNSWGNVGGTQRRAAYAVDAQGVVHLQGAISGGEVDEAAFTLPASVMPAAADTLYFPVPTGNATTSYIALYQDGVYPEAGNGVDNTFVVSLTSLEGVTFSAG